MISNEEISEKMVEAVRSKLGNNLKKVILYGSMARHENTLESDFDCIAVVEKINRELIDALDDVAGEMLIHFNAVFSIIPVKELSMTAQKYNPLFLNVNREGIVLWPKSN